MDHGVLAADLVGSDGQILAELLSIANNVEVLAGRLDHDNVGTLVHITNDGSASKAAASGGKLVASAVTKGRGRAGSVSEGSVQTARELGRVRHEQGLVSNSLFDQLEFDGTDTAIVHVRRRNTVGSGLGIGKRNIRNAINRHLVVQAAVVPQDTAVAVRGILAEADIGADEDLRETTEDELNGLDNRALGIISCAAQNVLGARLLGNTKQHDRSQSLVDKRLEEGRQPVDADLVLARKRGHMDHVVLAIGDEDGVNEHRLQMSPSQ